MIFYSLLFPLKKGGAGLAFISYPDAIARFQFIPQVNWLFFFFSFHVFFTKLYQFIFICFVNNTNAYTQFFSVLFFFMLFVLGIGSNIALW